ncbi:PIR Superfamily Protein [Plasmodium ovale wallikeri]|uniref:PIR Superfamily Protein n=1 Tax=Plasmodium ovale wallikeri TaxID=864142 RepID=A0A1A9ARU6_PLAOA|nr:PIR Superfamily Protein [Plasmodium ovale wallikeri]SBT58887.1 PIR Superfamily Protein [Plasmodium ovale wallikeri]
MWAILNDKTREQGFLVISISEVVDKINDPQCEQLYDDNEKFLRYSCNNSKEGEQTAQGSLYERNKGVMGSTKNVKEVAHLNGNSEDSSYSRNYIHGVKMLSANSDVSNVKFELENTKQETISGTHIPHGATALFPEISAEECHTYTEAEAAVAAVAACPTSSLGHDTSKCQRAIFTALGTWIDRRLLKKRKGKYNFLEQSRKQILEYDSGNYSPTLYNRKYYISCNTL